MAEVAIRLPKEKLIEGLSTLSFKEIKEIIDSLIQNKDKGVKSCFLTFCIFSKFIKRL